MFELLVVLALVAVIVLLVVLVKRKPKQEKSLHDLRNEEARRLDPDADNEDVYGNARNLDVGDIFEVAGKSYVVRGVVDLKEGGFTWKEVLLDSVDTKKWLSIEEDPDLEVVLWTESAVSVEPGARTITHEGVSYDLEENGTAKYAGSGTTGLKTGNVEYYDYEGTSGQRLSFERYDGGTWEAGTGEIVRPGVYKIYPGGISSGLDEKA